MKGIKFAIAGLVSVALVADLFGKPTEEIARRVRRFRTDRTRIEA